MLSTGLSSCNEEVSKRYEAKPVALGRMNEVVLIADKDLATGAIRDSFDLYFGSSYPIMPTPEPIFDIRHFTTEELEHEPLRKELRTYVVLADINDEDSPTTKMIKQDLGAERFREAKEGLLTSSVGKAKWAKKQIIIYLFARGEEALAKVIREKFPAVAKRINQHDEEQLAASLFAVRNANPGLQTKIARQFGLDIRIPADFNVAINDPEVPFLWLRKDTKDAILNMTFAKYSYTDPGQLDKDAMLALRNTIGKNYITSNTAGSYMTSNETDLPLYEYVSQLEGTYVKEIRGVWEMTKDYMGGPFVLYGIVNEAKRELIVVDVFVYAAGKQKRNYIQQLDYLVKQSKLALATEGR